MGIVVWGAVMNVRSPLQKIRTSWIVIPVLAVAAVALGTFWFLHNFEKKAFEEVEGGSPAAWKNPLLAARKYLEASGKKVVGYHGIDHLLPLPPPDGALFIRRLPRGLGKDLNDQLFSWVESGGHLLITPDYRQNDTPENYAILHRLGVQRQKDGADCKCPPKKNKATDDEKSKNTKNLPTSQTKKLPINSGYHPFDSIIDLTIDGFPIHLKYFGAHLLEDKNNAASFRINGSYRIKYRDKKDADREDNNTIKEKSGNWLLEYKVGSGKITVLSESGLFTNQTIGDYDHAFFLSWLLKDDHAVRLLISSEAKGLPAILWDKMPFFWASVALAIVLALWRMQKQSGTLVRVRTDEQLNILAHIDASGMFSWRIEGARSTIASNRKAMLQRWNGSKPGPDSEEESRRLSVRLVSKAGISEKDVFDAFQMRIDSEQDLIKTSRALQKIDRRLHGGESTQHDR